MFTLLDEIVKIPWCSMFYIYYDLVSGEFASQLWKQGWNNNNYHVAVSLVSSCREMSVISSHLGGGGRGGGRERSCALWASCSHLRESPACTGAFILRCFSMCYYGKKFFHLPCLTFLCFFVSSIFCLFFSFWDCYKQCQYTKHETVYLSLLKFEFGFKSIMVPRLSFLPSICC